MADKAQDPAPPCSHPRRQTASSALASRYSATVEVLVGENRQRFQVNEDPLTEESEYFRAWLRGHGTWQETTNRSVTLSDVNPGIFSIFIHWVYTNELLLDEEEGPEDLEEHVKQCMADLRERYPDPRVPERLENNWHPEAQGSAWPRLIAAYILGDRLQSSSFKNAVIDEGISWYHKGNMEAALPSCETVRYGFEHTYPGSTLRNMLLDTYYWRCNLDTIRASLCSAQHPDAVVGLANRLADHEGLQMNLDRRQNDAGAAAEVIDLPITSTPARMAVNCANYHDHRRAGGSNKRPYGAVDP